MSEVTREEIVSVMVPLSGVIGVASKSGSITVYVEDQTVKKEVEEKLKETGKENDVDCEKVSVEVTG